MKVGIVGGGIGGLSTALALENAGIDYHLHEQASAFGEVGAGIMLTPDIVELLDQWGIGDNLRKKANAIADLSIFDHLGKKIISTPTQLFGYFIHRADLIQVLSEKIPAERFSLGQPIKAITQANNKVSITYQDQSHQYDLLIAADGIRSNIRQQVLPKIQPRYTKQTSWRGIAEIDTPMKWENSLCELWGENLRFGFVKISTNKWAWYAFKWIKPTDPTADQDPAEFLSNLFNNFHPQVNTIIANTKHFIKTDLYDIPPHKANWYHDKICFIGDSIHAITPHVAQGACQAIESAHVLTTLLKREQSIEQALQAYTKFRRSRIHFITRISHFFGAFSHVRTKAGYHRLFWSLRIAPSSIIAWLIGRINTIPKV